MFFKSECKTHEITGPVISASTQISHATEPEESKQVEVTECGSTKDCYGDHKPQSNSLAAKEPPSDDEAAKKPPSDDEIEFDIVEIPDNKENASEQLPPELYGDTFNDLEENMKGETTRLAERIEHLSTRLSYGPSLAAAKSPRTNDQQVECEGKIFDLVDLDHKALNCSLSYNADGNELIIGWAGTTNSAGFRIDTQIAPGNDSYTKREVLFIQAINKKIASIGKPGLKVTICGHSLGGSLAQRSMHSLARAITQNKLGKENPKFKRLEKKFIENASSFLNADPKQTSMNTIQGIDPNDINHISTENICCLSLGISNASGVVQGVQSHFYDLMKELDPDIAFEAHVLMTGGDPVQTQGYQLIEKGNWSKQILFMREPTHWYDARAKTLVMSLPFIAQTAALTTTTVATTTTILPLMAAMSAVFGIGAMHILDAHTTRQMTGHQHERNWKRKLIQGARKMVSSEPPKVRVYLGHLCARDKADIEAIIQGSRSRILKWTSELKNFFCANKNTVPQINPDVEVEPTPLRNLTKITMETTSKHLTKEIAATEKTRLIEEIDKIQKEIIENIQAITELTEQKKETGDTPEVLMAIAALSDENTEKEDEIDVLKKQIKTINESEPQPII